ncbi:MAG: hypothetical protein K9G62_00215 [Alphaproteobacteria bacterium]|nr:hypothetical protein [Alphaproteobacteria bacterium]
MIQGEDRKLTGERFEELYEALDILYIRNNISGRLQFLKAWPAVAAHVFGQELIVADTEGTDDRKGRAVLEGEAENRRASLLILMKNLEAKSASDGVLQKEYVSGVVQTLGIEIARILYAEKITERFTPDLKHSG